MKTTSSMAALKAIRQAGSVSGLVLCRREEILFQDSSHPAEQMLGFISTLNDIGHYFEQERRNPDQLVFGYEHCNLLIVLLGEFRLAVFFHQDEEVDFIARIARSFLKDYTMSQLTQEFVTAHS